MKQKFLIALLVIVTSVALYSCTEEELVTIESLEDRVNNASVIPGEIPFLSNPSDRPEISNVYHIYVAIPGKNGYVKIEKESSKEADDILILVRDRFDREFREGYLSSGRIEGCGEWEASWPDDPNTGYFRLCTTDGSISVETCPCPYCCG